MKLLSGWYRLKRESVKNNLKEDSMRILVLNGSPRPEGNMKKMIAAFEEGAKLGGH